MVPSTQCAQRDLPTGWGKFDRVVDKIANRFEQEARVARQQAIAGRFVVDHKRNTLPLGHRFVEICDIGDHGLQVEGFETGATRSRFNLRDPEQGIERCKKSPGFYDRVVNGVRILLIRGVAPPHPFEAGQEPRQWRA